MFTSSLSLKIPWIHAEFLVIIQSTAMKTASVGNCCLRSLKEKRIILYSQRLPKKLKLYCIKNRKIHETLWKYVFVWRLSHSHVFFRAAVPESRTKDHTRGPLGPSSTVAFFSNYKQNTKVWNLKLHYYREEHKSYLQGYFSSLRFDLEKIFI